jgi:hypothetical protein
VEQARLVLNYIEVLIWPVVVTTLVLAFRKNIAGLVDRLRSAKGFGLEGVFDAIEEIEEDPTLDPEERQRIAKTILSHVAVETVFSDGRWMNRIGNDTTTHSNREDAIVAGRDEARSRQLEHVIRSREGLIVERNSYGADSSLSAWRTRRRAAPRRATDIH